MSWRTLVISEARRLHLALQDAKSRSSLAWSGEGDEDALIKDIERNLGEAFQIAHEGPEIIPRIRPMRFRSFLSRLFREGIGPRFEDALAPLARASEGLLLVQSGPAVLAEIPDLRAGVKARLKVTDPRFDVFMRVLDNLEKQAGLTHEGVAEPQALAHDAGSEDVRSSRGVSNAHRTEGEEAEPPPHAG